MTSHTSTTSASTTSTSNPISDTSTTSTTTTPKKEKFICISPILKLKKLNGQHYDFKVNPGKNRIGRASSNDIYLKDEPTVSNYHAQLEFNNNNKFLIRDLYSSNKTSIQFKDHDELITLKPNIDYEIINNSKIVLGSATMILNYIEVNKSEENVNNSTAVAATSTTSETSTTVNKENKISLHSQQVTSTINTTNKTSAIIEPATSTVNTTLPLKSDSNINLPSKSTSSISLSPVCSKSIIDYNNNEKDNSNHNDIHKRKDPESNNSNQDKDNKEEEELHKSKKLKSTEAEVDEKVEEGEKEKKMQEEEKEEKEKEKEAVEEEEEEEDISSSPTIKQKSQENEEKKKEKESSKDSQQSNSNSQNSNLSGESSVAGKKRGRKSKSLINDEFTSQIANNAPLKRKSVKPERLEEQVMEISSSPSSTPSKSKKSQDTSNSTTALNPTTNAASNNSKNVKVLFSMFSEDESKELESIITKLGGQVAKNSEECTHLVANELKRSKKILECISYGKLIVTSKWLKDSKKSSKWVNESQYHLIDKKAESEWSFNLEKSLELARSNHENNTLIFKDLSFHITKNSVPPKDFLKELIEINGGTLDDNLSNQKSIILANPDKDKRSFKKWIDSGHKLLKGDFILLSILSQDLIYNNCELK